MKRDQSIHDDFGGQGDIFKTLSVTSYKKGGLTSYLEANKDLLDPAVKKKLFSRTNDPETSKRAVNKEKIGRELAGID